jgi:putative ABC transport system permease protein
MSDLRYALRTFTAAPLFATIVVVTLAAGIGPTTAIFSIVQSLLLREPPYADMESLVSVWRHRQPGDRAPVSGPDFADFQRLNNTMKEMALSGSSSYNVGSIDQPVRVEGARVTPNFFALLGTAPLAGALPSGAARDVVLSYGLWETTFGKSPQAIGREIRINGESHRIVAVMPRAFGLPEKAALWIPFEMTAGRLGHRAYHQYRAIARLKPGVTVSQADADMKRIAAWLGETYPDTTRGIGATVEPLQDTLVGPVRRPLLILLAAVFFLLLIACSNAANLMLTRAAGRQREFAVRSALGASRTRVARQLLTEALLLSLAGGALGLLLAYGSVALVRKLGGQYFARPELITINGGVLLFNVAICIATGLLFGLAPVHALDGGFASLKSGVRTATNRGWESRAVRESIVVAVVALSYFLLVGAGLLIISHIRLRSIDLGLRTQNLMTFRIFLPESRYPDTDTRTRFYQNLVQRLRTTPGIERAATVSGLPLNNTMSGDFAIEGRPDPTKARRIASFTEAGPDYFATAGIPMLQGRDFTDDDTRQIAPKFEALGRGENVVPPPVIVNQTLVRRFFEGEPVLGRRVLVGGDTPGIIVGVVGDVRQKSILEEPPAHVYFALGTPLPPFPMSFVARSSLPAGSVTAAIRQHLRALDPDVPPYSVRTAEEVVSDAVAGSRFHAVLLSVFAVIALVLATIGIYGVVSYGVSQRTREMGIRMAVGASSSDLLKLVVGQVMRLAAIGVAIGATGALLMTRSMEALLYEVSSVDARSFIAVGVLLFAVALVASANPARNAASVDPNVSLRYE